VLNAPLGWSEEVIIATWLWTVLWGAAFTLSEAEEIRFDIIYSNISERTRRVFTVITGVVLVVIYAVSLPAAFSYVSFMKVEHSAYLRVPLDWMYSIFIVFTVACIGRYCWLVWRALRGEKSPETDPAKLGD
jgi:TRAP-type C4-dicarboxylate transport system permease small subunit